MRSKHTLRLALFTASVIGIAACTPQSPTLRSLFVKSPNAQKTVCTWTQGQTFIVCERWVVGAVATVSDTSPLGE